MFRHKELRAQSELIKPFFRERAHAYSTNFQWALHLYRAADRCRYRQREQHASLQTAADVADWARRVRQYVLDAIGGLIDLPTQTPYLVERQIENDGIRIELISYEAFIGLVVPGVIYFPNEASFWETPLRKKKEVVVGGKLKFRAEIRV